MSPIHGPRGMVLIIEDKAEALADILETNCKPNYVNADEQHIAVAFEKP